MLISLNKLQNVLLEFVEAKMLPVAPPIIKFLIGGAVPVVLNKFDEVVNQYRPQLELLGLLTKEGKLDIEKASSFIRGGFSKTESITLYNFKFNKEDGEFLINLTEKYKDD